MQENENSFNLDLLDLRGSEGVVDYCPKTNTVIYSVGSMLVYWELVKDKKLYINYHESTIAAIKISHLGNYFLSIDKNKFPNIVFWAIPSLDILYQSKLSVNFRSDKDKFPEETKFLRENNMIPNFNLKSEISKDCGFIINDIFIEFFQSNAICLLINIEQYDTNPFHENGFTDEILYKNYFGSYQSKRIRKQIFYFFEMLNSIHIKFFKVIDNENHCYGIKTFLNGNIISMEEKSLKFWKIDYIQNKIKLKTKIHIKQRLVKNQLQICEYLKMIIILNENNSCLILDETGVFLLSINPDFGPLSRDNRFNGYEHESDKYRIQNNVEVFISIKVFNETLLLTTNRGNAFVYDLNGFKFIGKIEYEIENKKKYLLNDHNRLKSKHDLTVDNLNSNNKKDNIISYGFYIRNLFIDEESDLVLANYSDNSISIFSYSNSIKNKNFLLGSKYRKAKKAFNFDSFNQHKFNLELNGNMNDNQKNFFLFSHFERITDICWLNNNYKAFITSSTDQSLMLWNYRGDKWVNHYFDLLKIFDKNLNNFQNQVTDEDAQVNLERAKSPNFDKMKEKKNHDNTLFKIKYFINVVISHPTRNDLLIAGDNKGNIYQFDCDLKEQPKKFVVGNFGINSLSFSRNGNYIAVGFSTGNVVLVDFTNNCKFCSIVEEYNNDNSEINERNRKNMLLSYCYIFKKFTYSDKISNFNSHNKNLDSLLKNSEMENSTIKIISMNSYKTLRMQLIKKSFLSNNFNLYNNLNRNINFNNPDKKDMNGNIPNNYFNSTIKNFNYNYKIKKIEMHVSEEYMIILFENNNILINRIESNIISGVITLQNQYLEFYDIKADPSGLYLAVLSDAFANQETLDFRNLENENEAFKIEERRSDFNLTSKQKFNFIDKNRSIEFKSNGLRSIENKRIDNNLYKSTTKTEFDDRAGKVKLTSNELLTIRDNIRKRSSIIVYEIGTGNFVCILKNLFVVSNFRFSNDGRFICLSSESGCVSVWNTSGEIRENIFSILEEIKINPNFWESFRINFCLEKAEKFNFFQKIENPENNKNYDLVKNIEENKQDKNVNRFKDKDQEENRKSQRNGVNSSLKFSIDDEKRSIDRQTFSNEKKKTDLNTNRATTNAPSYLNNAKLTTTYNFKDTSYKSLYLNLENTNNNYKNSVRELNLSISNRDENLINRSSRGKIFSNYPLLSRQENNNKSKNSHSSIDKHYNLSPKQGNSNMLYSSSNLYKKNFQVEELLNLDNRASKANLKSTEKGNFFHKNIENNNNFISMKNSQVKSSNDYLINFSKEKMMVNVFPDPEDIDNLVDDNLANNRKIVSPPLLNQIDLNPSLDNIVTEEFFENSKIKGSTADQIEYIDNNINNFEKNFIRKLDINDTSNSKFSRNVPVNIENSKNRSYLKDSIDN